MNFESLSSDQLAALASVRCVVSSVRSVLTKRRRTLGPHGEIMDFSADDAPGALDLKENGIYLRLTTGKGSDVLTQRAGEMFALVYLKDDLLLPGNGLFETIEVELKIPRAQVLYIGAARNDWFYMREAGVAVMPPDGRKELREIPGLIITNMPGGEGVLEEVAEMILRAQGKWDAVLESYRKGPRI